MNYTLGELAEKLEARLHGDASCLISSVASLSSAQAGAITFCDKGKHHALLQKTEASAVILSEDDLAICPTNALITANPYLTFAKAAAFFSKKELPSPGIHPTAILGKHCTISSSAYIGPYVVIEDDVVIGDHTLIHAQCFVGRGCQLGKHITLYPHVTLYSTVVIGDHTIIHSGTVIGADGFGYSPSEQGWHKIPQLGSVHIGQHVEIGANTTIDRGTLEATTIGDGVKLDNLIMVAHNVRIGENTAIAACTGISGSTVIGKNCIIAGGVGIAGHLHIADHVTITGMAMVTKSITEPGIYSSGTGLLPNKEWRKNAVRFRQLNELALKIKELESDSKKSS